jgi:hypothetical protein
MAVVKECSDWFRPEAEGDEGSTLGACISPAKSTKGASDWNSNCQTCRNLPAPSGRVAFLHVSRV